jgi:hypothetical protein
MKYAHVDESVVIFYAMRFLSGDLHPRVFFDYPSLFLYTLAFLWHVYHALGMLLGAFGPLEEFIQRYLARDAADIYILARALSAVCGAATVWVVYRTGVLLYNHRVGLVAALLLAMNPLHILHCHYATPDAAAVLLVTVGAHLLLRGALRDMPRDIIFGCAVIGLGASTKYYPAALLVNAALFPFCTRDGYRPAHVRTVLLGWAVAAGSFLLGTPYALLDFPAFRSRFSVIYSHVAQPEAAGLIPRMGSALHHLAVGIGPLCILVLVIGAIRREASRMERYLFSFPLVLFLMISPWKAVSPHYLLPLFPFLFIGVAAVMDRIARQFRPWIFPAGAALCAAWFVPNLVTTGVTLSKPDTRLQASAWIQENVPPGSNILRFPYTAEFKPGEPYQVTVDWEGAYGPDSYDRFDYVIVADTVVDRGNRFVLECAFSGRRLSRFHNPTVRIYRNTVRPPGTGVAAPEPGEPSVSRTTWKRSNTSSVSREQAIGREPMNEP